MFLGHEEREEHRGELVIRNDDVDTLRQCGGDQPDPNRRGRNERDVIRSPADEGREVTPARFALAVPLRDPVRLPGLPAAECARERVHARRGRQAVRGGIEIGYARCGLEQMPRVIGTHHPS
jgi:hypothetical protein